MDIDALFGKHLRLRKELADAYSVSPWEADHIDRLVTDLAVIELQLSREQRKFLDLETSRTEADAGDRLVTGAQA